MSASGTDMVEFALRLDNQIKQNADAIVSELEAVDAAMKRTGKTEREVRAAMRDLANAEKVAGEAAKKLAAEQKSAAEKAEKAHAAAMERVGQASDAANDSLKTLAAEGAVSLAAIAVGLGLAAEKFAIEAGDFKTKTLLALETMEGSKKAANDTLNEMRAGANALGLPTEKITAFYNSLRTAGFTANEVKSIMSAGLDVGSRLGEQGGDVLVKSIEMIRAKGAATIEVLGSLKEAGIADPDAFYRALANQQGATKGLDPKRLKAMLEAKQIDSNTAINAILSVVQEKFDKGGALGSAAKEVGQNTVGGQLQTLKNQFTDIFADASVGGPLLDILKEVNSLLGDDTESGKEIRRVLGDAFSTVGDALSKITPKDIEKTVHAMIKMADATWDISKALGGSLGKNLGKVLEPLGKLFDGSEEGSGKLDVLIGVFETLGAVVGQVGGSLVGTFLAVPTALVGLYDDLKDIFDRIPHSWDDVQKWWDDLSLEDVGENLVDGLWDGITSTWRKMLEKLEDLLDLLPDAAKKALGIASPSKVFMEIGAFTGEGFTEGIESQNDNARAAMVDLVSPPSPRAPTIQPFTVEAPAQIATGGGSFSIGELHLHFDGVRPDASPADIGRAVNEYLRELAREMGATDEEAA